MRDNRFPARKMDGETISADQCRRLLEKLTSSDFYGDCTIRFKGGQIYNVTTTQSIAAETINKLIS